ncbi:hypothetical protein [Spiroplasma endosymbiont of Tipula paludosa]|uniref:hypothetical protein n=1 Tax=Spiroplasma endosymbiont of Tipula paludosa TaxID=3066295 RepID=UPI0035C92545
MAFWTEKFCSLNPQVLKITGDIKLIKIINENTENDNLEEAYIYVLTTESLYLIYNNRLGT